MTEITNRIGCIAAVFLSVVICLFIFHSCSTDFHKEIQKGYVLLSTNPPTTYLVEVTSSEPCLKHVRTIVPPNIRGIAWQGDYIYGWTTVNPRSPYVPTLEPTAGYFIVNIKTGNVERGLKVEEWMRKLKAAGIKHPRDLWKPRTDIGGFTYQLWSFWRSLRGKDYTMTGETEWTTGYLGDTDTTDSENDTR